MPNKTLDKMPEIKRLVFRT